MNVFLWPFRIIWSFIGFFLGVLGRVLSAVIGLVFIGIGFLLTITVIASFIGVPMLILGILLLIRSIF